MKKWYTYSVTVFVLLALLGCKRELPAPYQGYFFLQESPGESYRLYLNEQLVGRVENTALFPVACIDSTLTEATVIPITHRKNDFVLVDALGTTLSEGTFKIDKNGTSYESTSNLGITYIKILDKTVVVGFNLVDFRFDEDPANICMDGM